MRYLLSVFFILVATCGVHAATCDAGEYLHNGECTECPRTSYCPGDDNIYECKKLYTTTLANCVSIEVLGKSKMTSADDCMCDFKIHTPDNKTVKYEYWRGQCAGIPTEYAGIYDTECRTGYYATNERSEYRRYEQCTPCTNAPENTSYTDIGVPEKNDCPWACNDNYRINSDGTKCDQLCTLGYNKIKTSGGITIPLYADRRTTPQIAVGDANGNACYADLAAGRATGAINVTYNDEIYHTISPSTVLQCGQKYYLNENNTCSACDYLYYCPGDNTRISCETAIIDEENVPRPKIYDESRSSGFYTSEQCLCQWTLSDERRVKYDAVGRCNQGAHQTNNTRVFPKNCRPGYYAVQYFGYGLYRDCATCYNGPENSHYTSNSTPSVTGAVESNCPWECDDGYRLSDDGTACIVAQ